MSFRESFYATKQLLVNRLQDFGLVSANMNMGWTTLLTIAQNTRVTIDVPLILTYSDAFLISGTLETSTYSRLNGKTVKLKVGNTVVDTTTTNANGEYSFTHSPVSTGNHSFQVIFEGTNIHSASESSVVTRTVGKETSVINLDAISTQHYGDTVIFGGQLLTNDGEYITNASVKYYLDNTLIDTLTTNAQGRFSTSKIINDFDTLDIDFIYDGDSNYVDCSSNTNINIYQKVLSLTANKPILDYSSNESAILTAQIKDTSGQNLQISGEEVEFGIINDEMPSPSSTVQPTMVILKYTGNRIQIGDKAHGITISTGDVLIDWGDGSSNTINNTTTEISHDYTDGVNNHTINLIGEITGLGPSWFYYYTGLTGVVIPNTVTSLGNACFYGCTGLVDYQLYWTGNDIIPYNSYKMPNNTNTVFTIPTGETSNYIANGYPSTKLQERNAISTTDATGKVTYTYESTGVGDVTIYAQCGLLQETFVIRDVYYANSGTTDKSSDFDIANLKVMNNLTKGTLSVTNDSEKYTFTATGFGNQALINIPNLNGLNTDYKYSAIVKNMGLIIYNTPVLFGRVEAPTGRAVYSGNWASPDWHTINTALNNLTSNTEYELQIISNSSSFTIKILDLNGTQLGAWSYTNSSLNNSLNTVYLGVYCFNGTGTLRNLTLELL